jgi:hypothetical protein
MYSCLKQVRAVNSDAALRQCPPELDAPHFAPAVAIPWPVESDEDKRWLEKHLGPGL